MLKVIVELWPGGRESSRRVIATAEIARVVSGALANYKVTLDDPLLPEVGDVTTVFSYPRWSGSVFDLVARCIAASLSDGREELPPRPMLPVVPVHVRDGIRYVRIDEIPEPTRRLFENNLAGSSVPFQDCAFAWDFEDFLSGQR